MVAACISVHIHICISINCIYKMDITSKSKMSLKMIEEKYDLLFNSVSLIVQRYCQGKMGADGCMGRMCIFQNRKQIFKNSQSLKNRNRLWPMFTGKWVQKSEQVILLKNGRRFMEKWWKTHPQFVPKMSFFVSMRLSFHSSGLPYLNWTHWTYCVESWHKCHDFNFFCPKQVDTRQRLHCKVSQL